MKVKRFLSLFLALVMSLALAVPALAAELPPELETVQSADADAPRYAVYTVPYRLDLDNNTYADLVFVMAEKSGKFTFESVDSISFGNTNPNGSHWDILEHSYELRSDRFILYVTVRDMEGNTPSSDYGFEMGYGVLPSQVMSYSRSAQNGNGDIQPPESVSARWCGEGTEEDAGMKLMRIRYGDIVWQIAD